MRRHVLPWSFLAALLLAATTTQSLAGAGLAGAASRPFTSQPASQIVTEALSATRSATSFSVNANVVTNNQTIGIHAALSTDHGSAGTVSLNGQVVHLIEIPPEIYFSAGSSFWQGVGGKAAAQLFAGRWVMAPTSNRDFASMGKFLDPHQLVDQFFSGLPKASTFRKGSISTVAGHRVIALTSTAGDGAGTLYVATAAPHDVIQVSGNDSTANGGITFTRFGLPVHVNAPKNAIDYTQLTGGGTSSN